MDNYSDPATTFLRIFPVETSPCGTCMLEQKYILFLAIDSDLQRFSGLCDEKYFHVFKQLFKGCESACSIEKHTS